MHAHVRSMHMHAARTVCGVVTALGGHRVVPKVAHERYCNIVMIFAFFLCTCMQV